MCDPELIIGRRPFHSKRDATYLYGFMRVRLDKPSSNEIVARQCFWLSAKLKLFPKRYEFFIPRTFILYFAEKKEG